MLARLSHHTRVPVPIWITPADELDDGDRGLARSAGCSGTTLVGYASTCTARGCDHARIVRRLVTPAVIDKKISPHSPRHSFIIAALDAGVPLRDVQEAASDCRASVLPAQQQGDRRR